MDKDDRKYGFKHIAKQYSWMTPGWIEELIKHEPDEDVCYFVKEILTDLTTPEDSRLESSTDLFDSIEDYSFNRLLANGTKLEDDKVYKWLVVSKDFFAKNEAYELCFNIQKAIDIVRTNLEACNNEGSVNNSADDLPF
jgi:D-mannonate dehydratase